MAAVATVRNSRYYWWVRPAGYWTDIPILKGVGEAHVTEEQAIAKAIRIQAARAAS